MESETETFKEQLFKDHPKDPKHFPLWLVLLVLVLIGAGAWFGYESKITDQNFQPKADPSRAENVKTEEVDLSDDVVLKDVFDTSNWQTYRNEEFGFEFQYPNHWKIIERLDINSVGLLPEHEDAAGDYFGDIYVYSDDVSITEVRDLYAEFTPQPSVTEYSLGFADVVVFRDIPRDVIGQSGYGEAYFTFEGQTVVVRRFWQTNDDGDAVFDQILSTFRFIE